MEDLTLRWGGRSKLVRNQIFERGNHRHQSLRMKKTTSLRRVGQSILMQSAWERSTTVKHGYDNIKECPCVGHFDMRIQARYASDTCSIRHVAYR